MLRVARQRFQSRFPAIRGGYSSDRQFLRAFGTQSQNPPDDKTRKRLDVAIVGAPNAGKSQLLNILTQSPVAAVSRKRHTTRTDILGARTIGSTQIVFKDTPGFLRLENAKEERLSRDLIVTAASEMQDVDYSLLVVDSARTLTDNYRAALVQLMIGAINSRGRVEEDIIDEGETDQKQEGRRIENQSKFAIVLNKVDLVKPKSKLLDLAMEIGAMADEVLLDQRGVEGENEELDFKAAMELSPIVFYVSALEEDGTDEILEYLVSLATTCRTWPVKPGESTNLTPLEQVEEMIREKIYRCLHQELPHSIVQVNRMFRKVPQGIILHQDLIVFSKSHQRLVLGSGGKTLQRIQDSAMRDLQKLFKCDVVLRLHIKLNKSKQRRSPEDFA